MTHLTTEQLEAGLDDIRASPVGAGTLEMIVRRPAIDEREVLETGELDTSCRSRGGHLAGPPEPADGLQGAAS